MEMKYIKYFPSFYQIHPHSLLSNLSHTSPYYIYLLTS